MFCYFLPVTTRSRTTTDFVRLLRLERVMKIYLWEDVVLLHVISAQGPGKGPYVNRRSNMWQLCVKNVMPGSWFLLQIFQELVEPSNLGAGNVVSNTLQLITTASVSEMRFVVPRPSEYLILFNQMSQIFSLVFHYDTDSVRFFWYRNEIHHNFAADKRTVAWGRKDFNVLPSPSLTPGW